jgi:hypothetical protein
VDIDWLNPLRSLPKSVFDSPTPWGSFPITVSWGMVAWAAIAAIPPLIVLLYFLKLKRQPLEVPSTFLWHKSIEDLHVNSIWQRLRQSLLLFLQLLLIALVILALLGPAWKGTRFTRDRLIFVIDNSASMSATDVQPTRLDEARRQVGLLIDAMQSGDKAMIITFSDKARVEQSFTDNRKLLRERLAAIQPTQRQTQLGEALKVASGLANPGQTAFTDSDAPVADALPAQLFLFSDGRFEDVKNFFWGNLDPVYVPIGQPLAGNVGIAAFSARQEEERPDKLQVFGRIENYGQAEATIMAELYLNDALADASEVTIKPAESAGVTFELDDFERGVLKLKITPDDALAIDNQAWTAVNRPRRAKVLCVTAGDEPLQYALTTGRAAEIADVTFQPPSFLATPDYQKQAESGAFDLIIFDRCQPGGTPRPKMPHSNTLFIGAVPPEAGWAADPKAAVPQIIDTDRAHPLMQLVELGNVLIADGTPLNPPQGATVLIDSNLGPLFAIAPREAHEDAVMGFELIGDDGSVGTNWHVRLSFPLFVLNVLQYLGRGQDALASAAARPGRPVTLKTETPVAELTITGPEGQSTVVKRGKSDTFHFSGTDRVGVYDVKAGGQSVEQFAVNLFDPAESQIEPRTEFKAGAAPVEGQSGYEPSRNEGWKWLVVLALAVLLFEWYIYNRRVYL